MEFRPATDADATAIARLASENDLLLDGLTPAMFERMLTWLYVEPPPKVRVQFVAEDNGALLAHYGALPLAYRVYGETWLAGLGSNLVIARERRAGMTFYAIQTNFQRAWQTNGMQFACGLVTRAGVLEPHLRAGWRKLGAAPVYAKPIRISHLVKARTANRTLRGLLHFPLQVLDRFLRLIDSVRSSLLSRRVRVTQESDFGNVPEALLEGFAASVGVSAVRNAATLQWRFLGNRDRQYNIFIARRGDVVVGYAVTRQMRMKGHDASALVDIVFAYSDRQIGNALLAACSDEAHRNGTEVIATIANPNSKLLPILRRNGYLRTSEDFSLVIQAPKGSREAGILGRAFQDWHITWFDHDYV